MSLNIDLTGVINDAIDKKLNGFDIEGQLKELLGEVAKTSQKRIEVKLGEDGVPKQMGVQHKQFEDILMLISIGENLMIKGEAGNGKSHVVEQVAKALNLPFHSMSVSNQTTKTDLLGFVDANGVYRYNGFISAFRDGGVFNMDEIDAGNPNVLVVLNSALSNGFIETPDGNMIYAHENFRFCSTANTVGRGANQKYVGRNKLDSATLDRFAVINFELDEDIELMLCNNDKKFHDNIKAMRKKANEEFEDFMVSQRSSIRLYKLLHNGFTLSKALDIAVFKGCDEDIVESLSRNFNYTVGKQEEKVEYKVEVEKEVKEDEEDKFEW